jgi:cell division GTPase FtsZ
MELKDAHLRLKLVSADPTHLVVSTVDVGQGTVTTATPVISTGRLS